LGFLAAFPIALVFRVRDQPAAEAWTLTIALADGIGFLLLLRLNGVAVLDQTFWAVAITLSAIWASIETAESVSAWTRSGRIATAVLLTALAFLAWKWWMRARPEHPDKWRKNLRRNPTTRDVDGN
jgi:hypothetical protein